MEQFRSDISKGCPLEQLMSEVKVLTREDRHSLLDMVAMKESVVEIPPEEVLAMKADLSITWSKLRILRR